jgi:DNA-binding CsgD family transcriptional regulator
MPKTTHENPNLPSARPLGSAFLTERERQVVKRLSEGATVKEIAIELKLSAKTVEHHSMNARLKIGNPSVAVLTRFAIINGISELLPNEKADAGGA